MSQTVQISVSQVSALLPSLSGLVQGQVQPGPGHGSQADLGPPQGAPHQLQRSGVALNSLK